MDNKYSGIYNVGGEEMTTHSWASQYKTVGKISKSNKNIPEDISMNLNKFDKEWREKLIAFFDENGVGNPSFKYIYNGLYDKLKTKYNIEHKQSDQKSCFSCPGGGSNFQVYNSKNKKNHINVFLG